MGQTHLKLFQIILMTAAAAAAGAFFQIFCAGNAPEFERFGDAFLNATLKLMNFFLGGKETGGDGVFEQYFPVLFKRGDFRRFKRLAVMLFFL